MKIYLPVKKKSRSFQKRILKRWVIDKLSKITLEKRLEILLAAPTTSCPSLFPRGQMFGSKDARETCAHEFNEEFNLMGSWREGGRAFN